jgi:ATP-binding cassette, subfamily B, bacterial
MSEAEFANLTRVEPGETMAILKRGWKASPELREGAGFTLVLATIGAAGRVVVPIIVQQAVDRGLDQDGVRPAMIAALGGLALTVVAVTTVANRFTLARLARSSERALYRLRTRAFDHVHRLSLRQNNEEQRGVLVSRVTSDVETLSRFFEWGGVAWLVNGLMVTVVAITMLVYDWRLALIAIASVIPLALIMRTLQKRMLAAWDEVRTRVGEMLSALSEAVMGAAVIRGFGVEDRTTAKADKTIHEQKRSFIRAGVLSAVLFPSGEAFAAVTVATVVLAGVILGPESGLTAGVLIAFLFLVTLFLEPVAEFTEILDMTQTAVAGWRKVLDLLDTPIDIVEPAPDEAIELPESPPRVEFDHVWFEYLPGVPVLRDISAVAEPGARVAIVGATGSGKSTLAKLLVRLADPTDGRILVHGTDVKNVTLSSLRRRLMLVPQENFLFDTTIADNVRYASPEASGEDVFLAFLELGLDDWIETLPRGLETVVGERGEHLSVGERQLVALARAYLANPGCLILDEATAAVDPATETRISRALESLSRGRTSITIAHRLATAERSDHILVLDEGVLVEAGTHAELLARDGTYAALHRSWLDASATVAAGARATLT